MTEPPATRGTRKGAGRARDPRNAGPLPMSEDDFQTRIIQTAKLNGWRVTHFRAVKMSSGRWAVPLQGDAGFPDLALARDGVVILAELKKSRTEKARDGQVEWLRAIGPAIGRLWCPEDWQAIVSELSRSATRSRAMPPCCNPHPRG